VDFERHLEDVYLAQKTTDAARVVCESAADATSNQLYGLVEHARLQMIADDARNAAMDKLYFELSYSRMLRSRVDHATSRRHRASMELSEAELELAKATTSCDDLTINPIEFGNAYRDIAAAYRDNLKKKYERIYRDFP
jgi:hypothetical protein